MSHSIGQYFQSTIHGKEFAHARSCNAELSYSTAFSTGYASRHPSSYKSIEQLFRVYLGYSVQQGLSAQYTILVTFSPPSLPLEMRFGLCFVLCHQIN